MKKLAWFTTVSLATFAAVYLLWEFRLAIFLFILSLVVAAVLRPMVDLLNSHGLPRGLALALTYLAVLGGIVGLVFVLGMFFTPEFQALASNLPRSYALTRNSWLAGSYIQQIIAQNFPDLNNLFQAVTAGQWNVFMQNFVGLTLGSLTLFSQISIVIVLSIYWSADQEHFKRLWLSLLPSEWRGRAREIWQNIESEIGAYLRSELIQSLLAIIILGIGYQLIGLQYPVLLALIGAVGWLIVWIGGLVAVIPALLVGLSINPLTGLAAAVFTIVVLAFLEFVVEPLLFDNRRLSSLLVVIMVLAMVEQYGAFGFFIAPPLAAALQIFARELVRPSKTPAVELQPPPTIQIDLLKERLSSVRTIIAAQPEPPSPEIISLANRLDDLINQAAQEQTFQEEHLTK